MTTSTATGQIRITRVPTGEAPEEIRQAWVNVNLPCEPILGYGSDGEHGVLSKKPLKRNRYSFQVPEDLAIEALEKAAPHAARWWQARGFPHPERWFVFAEEEAEIISGVTYQKVHHINELDAGVNDRFFQQ